VFRRRLLAIQWAHIDVLEEQIDSLGGTMIRCPADLSPAEPPAMPAAKMMFKIVLTVR
jgi:hypothetical protein